MYRSILAPYARAADDDAILFSAGANAAHGYPRTNQDKRNDVLRLLNDEEWGQWSDREIARACVVSPDTVGRIGNIHRDYD